MASRKTESSALIARLVTQNDDRISDVRELEILNNTTLDLHYSYDLVTFSTLAVLLNGSSLRADQ